MANIFICYARNDEVQVKELYKKLAMEGFEPWLDKENLLGGQNWKICIRKAIKEAALFLACMSRHSVTHRGFFQKEIREALAQGQEKLPEDIYIIPVRLENCKVPEYLSEYHWIDLYASDGWEKLLKTLREQVPSSGENLESPALVTKPTGSEEDLQPALISPTILLTAPEKHVLFRPLGVDPETGLPDLTADLEEVRKQLVKIENAAKKAAILLEKANGEKRFSCEVELPTRAVEAVRSALGELDLLGRYSRQVKLILEYAEADQWKAASTKLDALPSGVAGSSALRTAVETGCKVRELLDGGSGSWQLDELCNMDLQHPILASLRREYEGAKGKTLLARWEAGASQLCRQCGDDGLPTTVREWLTTPLPEDRSQLATLRAALDAIQDLSPDAAIKKLREAAGVNQTALLATIGDVEGVTTALHGKSRVPPHNLAVANFSRLRQCGVHTEPEVISRAIGVCALLACCEPYRETLAQRFQRRPPNLQRGRVRSTFKKLLDEVGIPWGEVIKAETWACRWEVECFAVSRIPFKQGEGSLFWPFGPELIRFHQLEKELGEVLAGNLKQRTWYGSCAASEAMLALGEPEAALASLPETDEIALSETQQATGYRFLDNPVETLRLDACRLRSDIWFHKLKRCRFHPETTRDEAVELARIMTACCTELVELGQTSPDVPSRLADMLGRALKAMLDQFLKPKKHLGRPVTVDDGRARKWCMDGVIDVLQQKAEGEYADLTRQLRLLRAKLLVELIDVAFEQWKQNQPRALLEEMLEMSEQSVGDGPKNNPYTHIARAEMLLLRAMGDTSEFGGYHDQARTYIQELKGQSAMWRWPSGAIQKIAALHDMAEGAPGGFNMWIRKKRLLGATTARTDPDES